MHDSTDIAHDRLRGSGSDLSERRQAVVGIVASRCQWTFATGPHAGASVSEHVVEWGPSALAIVGLVVAVAGVGSWMWFRTKHINVARTDRG